MQWGLQVGAGWAGWRGGMARGPSTHAHVSLTGRPCGANCWACMNMLGTLSYLGGPCCDACHGLMAKDIMPHHMVQGAGWSALFLLLARLSKCDPL